MIRGTYPRVAWLLAAVWLLRARTRFQGPGKEALAAMDEAS